jgi:hypothetical protein
MQSPCVLVISLWEKELSFAFLYAYSIEYNTPPKANPYSNVSVTLHFPG